MNIVFDRESYEPGDPATITLTGVPGPFFVPVNYRITMDNAIPIEGQVSYQPFDAGVIGADRWSPAPLRQFVCSGLRRGGVVTATARWLGGQATVQATVPLLVPTSFGFSPDASGSPSLQDMIEDFHGVAAIGSFRTPSQGLPMWSSTLVQTVRSAIMAHEERNQANPFVWLLRFKRKDQIQALPDWVTYMPSWLSARIESGTVVLAVSYRHEPEQGPPSDLPANEWRSDWIDLLATMEDHPKRHLVQLGPTYTTYALKRDSMTWYEEYGNVATLDGVDFVGFDSYDDYGSGATPSTSEQMFGDPLGFAKSIGRPLLIAEWGRERRSGDTSGVSCASNMINDRVFLNTSAEQGWPVIAVLWFYSGGDNLEDREQEKLTLKSMI